jgi:hypothetical protein
LAGVLIVDQIQNSSNTLLINSGALAANTIGSTQLQSGLTLRGTTTANTIGASSGSVLSLQSNGTTNATLDANGNFGLGVTPSSWSSGTKAFETTNGTALANLGNLSQTLVLTNAYWNGTNYIYKNTASASYYNQNSGLHEWFTAPSGTAGNTIPFTQAMTLDTNGRLTLNATSALGGFAMVGLVQQTSDAYGFVAQAYTNDAWLRMGHNGTTAVIESTYNRTAGNTPLTFWTSEAEQARIDTSGNLGLGVTPSAWSGFRALQIGGATSLWSPTSGNGSSYYSNNIYYNGSNRVYLQTGYASEYQMTSSGTHAWFTAASGSAGGAVSLTQAMTIDASGNLLLGITTNYGLTAGANFIMGTGSISSSYNIHAVYVNSYSLAAGVPQFCANWPSAGNWGIGPNTNSSDNTLRIAEVTISSGGWAWSTNYANVVGGSWTNSSDYRLKKNVITLSEPVLPLILQSRPVSYNVIRKDDDGNEIDTPQEIGFIAHEIQELFPTFVIGKKDDLDGNGNIQSQSVDYAKMVAICFKAIQELSAQITELQTKVGT